MKIFIQLSLVGEHLGKLISKAGVMVAYSPGRLRDPPASPGPVVRDCCFPGGPSWLRGKRTGLWETPHPSWSIHAERPSHLETFSHVFLGWYIETVCRAETMAFRE